MNTNSLHYKYIIFILALSLVALLTKICTPDTALTQYVSFAATISSLILAVLAIIQGFISTSANDMAIIKIDKSSSEIIENSKRLTNIIKEFDEKFKDIPDQINILSNKFDSKFFSNENNAEQDGGKKPKFNNTDFKYIFDNSTIFGKLAIYAASLSFQKNKFFDRNSLFINDPNVSKYGLGYLVALKSTGLFDIEKNEVLIKINNFNSLNGDLEKNIKDIIATEPEAKNREILNSLLENVYSLFPNS